MTKTKTGIAYQYPRPALTVDAAVFGLDTDEHLKLLLIKRKLEPFKNSWALPGGFIRVGESAEDAVKRELEEEASLRPLTLEQVSTFSAPDRDPREHVITIAYLALVRLSDHSIKAASDAQSAAWFALDELPPLAFDHDQIIESSLRKLRSTTHLLKVGIDLLPAKFPLRALQSLYEQILERHLDKRNFRRQILEGGLVEELDEYETDVHHRAAKLYRIDKRAVRRLV